MKYTATTDTKWASHYKIRCDTSHTERRIFKRCLLFSNDIITASCKPNNTRQQKTFNKCKEKL